MEFDDALAWLDLAQHDRRNSANSGAGRGVGWGAMSSHLSRSGRVRRALMQSADIAHGLVAQRLPGLDVSAIWPILMAACRDVALCAGGSSVVGAVFVGSVGIAPGIVGRSVVGQEAGSWLGTLLGLTVLDEDTTESVPAALSRYERGFRAAWGPSLPPRDALSDVSNSAGNTHRAAFEFANGHALTIAAIFSALLAHLSDSPGERARLLDQIRQSQRLGPAVALWFESNETALRQQAALQPRQTAAPEGAAALAASVLSPTTVISPPRNVPPPPPQDLIYRQDDYLDSHQGAAPGRLKSYLNADGNLSPADPNGTASPLQHVRGSEPTKSKSPYTSFSQSQNGGKAYGNNAIAVDVGALNHDIAAGHVQNVEVVRHEDLLKMHDRAISDARARLDAHPSEKNQTRLQRAQMDKQNSVRDQEVLIRGVVPKKYITR